MKPIKLAVRLLVVFPWLLCILIGDGAEWAEEKLYAVMEWGIEP